MQSALTRKQIVAVISSVSEDFIWLLDTLERRKGDLSFPPKELRAALSTLGVSNYQHLYEDERAIKMLPVMTIFSPEGPQLFAADFEAADEQGRTELIVALYDEVGGFIQRLEFSPTPAQVAATKKLLDSMTEAELRERLLFEQRFCLSLVTSFNQLASVIVHGTRLTNLVEQAKEGGASGDDAFVKAVQIDNGILHNVPAFRARWESAKDCGDRSFLGRLGRVYGRPPYGGRIRHKATYIGFALLQDFGVLDELKHREILDILDESGLNLAKEHIEDVQYLTKRLIEFRKFQKTGVVSMQ